MEKAPAQNKMDMQNAQVTAEKDPKLPIKLKLAYSMGSFANNFVLLTNMFYLLFFYTDVLKISAGAAATILLIARVWDFINDPIMGIVCDRTNVKGGSCRFWIKIMAAPLAISLVLSFTAPNLSPHMRIVWALVTYIAQGMCNTAIGIPYNALRPKLTKDQVERVALTQWTSIFATISSSLVPAISIPLIGLLVGQDMSRGFMYLTMVYGVIVLVSYLIVVWGTKGYEPEGSVETGPQVTVKDSLKALLQNKMALVLGLSQLTYLLLSSIATSVLLYYVTYNLGNPNIMSYMTLAQTVGGFIFVLSMRQLVKKLGIANTCIASLLILLAGILLRMVTRDGSMWIPIVGFGMWGLGANALSAMTVQGLMESIEYGRWKTGVGNQALVMSINGFAAKAGIAFGSVIAGYVLQLVGYIPGAEMQSEHTMNMLFHLNLTIPFVFFCLILLVYVYIRRIEKMMPRIHKELQERELEAKNIQS